ncbi:MAG: hypothetical protein H7Z75_09110 [Ferruginibacter sp.]|nr:hypothetical protein [Cytophagales bacterium]
MRKLLPGCVFLLTVLSGRPTLAQDVLYQIDERKINCKITDINAKTVKYSNPANPGPTYALDRSALLMAFNGNGNYLVFSGGDDNADRSSRSADFLNATLKRDFDILITLDNEVIAALVERVGDSDIAYQKREPGAGNAGGTSLTVDKANVLVILYRDGRHELLISPTDAATVLQTVRTKVQQLSGTETGNPPADTTATTRGEAEKPASVGGINFDLAEYRNKALQKIDELGGYINSVSNKKTAFGEANKAIELACELFLDKGQKSYVEVSSLYRTRKDKYPVRTYLNRLKLTKYDKVEVTVANIEFVSDLKKGTDGNYYGVVTFEQRFTGYVEGKPVYSDFVRKNVTVVLKGYTSYNEGQAKEQWDVFLADVEVIETRA